MIGLSRSRRSRGGARPARFRRSRAAALALVAVVALGAPLRAEENGDGAFAEAFQQQIQRLFTKARDAVVRIEAADDHGTLAGTGFFVDPNGTLLTSYTVGGDTRDIVVIVGELKYPARRVLADSRGGVAILKVDAKTPFLPLGSSRALQVGLAGA